MFSLEKNVYIHHKSLVSQGLLFWICVSPIGLKTGKDYFLIGTRVSRRARTYTLYISLVLSEIN